MVIALQLVFIIHGINYRGKPIIGELFGVFLKLVFISLLVVVVLHAVSHRPSIDSFPFWSLQVFNRLPSFFFLTPTNAPYLGLEVTYNTLQLPSLVSFLG